MTLMCLDRSPSPTHKGNFLQGGKSNNNHRNQRRNSSSSSSCSSPPPPSSGKSSKQDSKGNSNSSRYKTELCRPFEESGTCKYGDKCQFAHGSRELRNLARHPKYKTELCRTFHSTGLCPYGPRCHFIHNGEPCKSPTIQLITNQSSQPAPIQRPKAQSLGSAGDMSPVSSHDGSVTSFDDLYQQNVIGNVFFPKDFNTRMSPDYVFDYRSDGYNDKVFYDSTVDNFSYHSRGPLLDLGPLTPDSADSGRPYLRLPFLEGIAQQ